LTHVLLKAWVWPVLAAVAVIKASHFSGDDRIDDEEFSEIGGTLKPIDASL
jgi:hypothetical protein